MDTNKRERSMLAAIFLFWFSVYTYPSFLSSYAENTLKAGSVLVGLIVGSYGFTQMVIRIPLGIFSDMIKKRKLFVQLGFVASMVASIGLAVVSMFDADPHPALAYAALICRGMAGVAASTWVAFSVLYSAAYPPEQTGAAMSRMAFPQTGSQVIAMLLGAYLMNYLGEIWAFLLATAAGIAGLAIISRVDDIPPPPGRNYTLKGLFEVAKDRGLITGTLLATLYQLVAWATVQGFVQNWAGEHVVGFTSTHLGWLSFAYLLPNTFVSRISGGKLSDKFGRMNVLGAGFMMVAIACCLYPFTRSVALLFVNQAIFGIGTGMILPLTMAQSVQNIPAEKKGAAMGMYQAIYGAGMFLGPVIAGAMIKWFTTSASTVPGYAANFYMCAVIAVLGAVVAIMTGRKKAH